ncbi:hypothetical protein, partial [Escherichia coli]|uniref:hypothetical protein n=1 Tax=Escherichia coli TaxID=562 RepID=UPI00211A715A
TKHRHGFLHKEKTELQGMEAHWYATYLTCQVVLFHLFHGRLRCLQKFRCCCSWTSNEVVPSIKMNAQNLSMHEALT